MTGLTHHALLTATSALSGLLAATFVGAGTPAQATQRCAGADVVPALIHEFAVAQSAITCLVDRERSAHGLGPLTTDGTLTHVGSAHARDMVRRRYFSHVSPSGRSLQARLLAHGWRGSVGGENIAWGSGRPATPAGIVRAWMQSTDHRANLLNPAFTRAGVSVAPGAPVRGAVRASITYAMEYDTP